MENERDTAENNSVSNELVLTQVREAYRLLFDFQDRVLDLIDFIGISYKRKYLGGYPKFSDAAPRKKGGNLNNWAWDWLNMYYYIFHFGTEKQGKDDITFGVFLVADDGFFRTRTEIRHVGKTKLNNFAPVDKSKTKLILVVGKNYWRSEGIFGDNWHKIEFILEEGEKSQKEEGGDGIMVFKSYSLAEFFDQNSAMNKLQEFSKYCASQGVKFNTRESDGQYQP